MTTTRQSSRIRERRPFAWLRPAPIVDELPIVATDGLRILHDVVQDDALRIARGLVEFTIVPREDGRRHAPPLSVMNRRRRSARLWLNAILDGRIDAGTLHAITHTWVPQLAGTGPEPRLAVRTGRSCIEYLRGAITSVIFDSPQASLIPEAKALLALETVLSIHLEAIRRIAVGGRDAAEKNAELPLRRAAAHR